MAILEAARKLDQVGDVGQTPSTLPSDGDTIVFNAATNRWFFQPGGGGMAPNSASYLVLGLDGTLTNERVFTPGLALAAIDGGANGAYTLNVVPSAINLADLGVKVLNDLDDVDVTGAVANDVLSFTGATWADRSFNSLLNTVFTSNGILVRAGVSTYTSRTIVAGSSKISVVNGDGVAGNPSIDVVPANIDHGALGGLADDDHTQYALLAGRAGGQTLYGATGASENLLLRSTSNATKGLVRVEEATALELVSGTAAMELRFYEPSASGTNFTAIKAQAQAADLTYTLPASITTNGFLKTNAGGDLTWSTLAVGDLPAHASTHHSGGSDPLSLGSIAGTIDISSQTNLAVTAPITLTGDTIGFAGLALNDLTDVVITAPATHHHFQYDGANWINQANISIGSGTDIRDHNGNQYFTFTATASAVNQINITNAATGTGPLIAPAGDDVSIDLRLQGKGVGLIQALSDINFATEFIRFANNLGIKDANDNETLIFLSTASAVNYVSLANAATNNPPIFRAAGDNSNVGLIFRWKGSGEDITFEDASGNIAVEIEALASPTRTIKLSPGTVVGDPRIWTTGSGNYNLELQAAGTGTLECLSDVRLVSKDILMNSSFGIRDDSDNEQLMFIKVASAVNYWEMTNAATAAPVEIAALGGDTNIGIRMRTKGTGSFTIFVNGTTDMVMTDTDVDFINFVRGLSFRADGDTGAGVASTVTYTNVILAENSGAATMPVLPTGYSGTTQAWLKIWNGTVEYIIPILSKT